MLRPTQSIALNTFLIVGIECGALASETHGSRPPISSWGPSVPFLERDTPCSLSFQIQSTCFFCGHAQIRGKPFSFSKMALQHLFLQWADEGSIRWPSPIQNESNVITVCCLETGQPSGLNPRAVEICIQSSISDSLWGTLILQAHQALFDDIRPLPRRDLCLRGSFYHQICWQTLKTIATLDSNVMVVNRKSTQCVY